MRRGRATTAPHSNAFRNPSPPCARTLSAGWITSRRSPVFAVPLPAGTPAPASGRAGKPWAPCLTPVPMRGGGGGRGGKASDGSATCSREGRVAAAAILTGWARGCAGSGPARPSRPDPRPPRRAPPARCPGLCCWPWRLRGDPLQGERGRREGRYGGLCGRPPPSRGAAVRGGYSRGAPPSCSHSPASSPWLLCQGAAISRGLAQLLGRCPVRAGALLARA